MSRRRAGLTAAALAASLALLLAGCGGAGGGGGGDEQGDVPPPSAGVPPAAGAGPQDSAAAAVAALGSPGAVDPARVGGTLAGYDRFGAPHDAFEQQVDEDETAGSEGATGTAPPIPEAPVDGDPLLSIPGAAGAVPATGAVPADPAAPGGSAADGPVQNPVALEADFDISGEPVVAREGDAIPPDTQQFVVEAIRAKEVTLTLSGGLLPDGSDTVTLGEGESITLRNATAGRSYRIRLVDVRAV